MMNVNESVRRLIIPGNVAIARTRANQSSTNYINSIQTDTAANDTYIHVMEHRVVSSK
jgi:hypothetical protein